ncbi:predicted protein [Sclerotinia sclerotiorum 1980 UF-70]|uniref:Uncharacterized protein n=1 Tax=Sclerotinia sclerotiorum (strain ATCC 18683 / 1980 / Ss-1) TaxID=665079 RepID=A7E7N8_SCLS1|nr:predicted protein [Sclerotinia sclerotiorum 1980 UF-70]EDN96390.1 predicted protein [Sclerotinia sclerotiorum 1980 UF-70]
MMVKKRMRVRAMVTISMSTHLPRLSKMDINTDTDSNLHKGKS